MQDDRFRVVGAEYSLETGVVDFFEGVETVEGADSDAGAGSA